MTRDCLLKRIAEAARKKDYNVSRLLCENEIGEIDMLLKDLKLELFGITPDQLSSLANNVDEDVVRVELFESKEMSIIAFGIKPGRAIPLHNHPYMYGFMKHVMGKGHIQSYTFDSKDDAYNIVDDRIFCVGDLVNVVKRPLTTVNTSTVDKVFSFNPKVDNFLSVVASQNEAVGFIDILIPPYDGIVKKLTFWRELLQTDERVLEPSSINCRTLEQIGEPGNFTRLHLSRSEAVKRLEDLNIKEKLEL